MAKRTSLKAEIAAWDAKSADQIRDIHERFRTDEGFLNDLVRYLGEAPLQRGASWLLKHHLEQNPGAATTMVAKKLYGSLEELEHWESKLHVLQSLPHLPIPKGQVQAVETFVRDCLRHEVKFVRAWAYGGFFELALRYPAYRPEALELFEEALASESASVKARIRNVTKKGF